MKKRIKIHGILIFLAAIAIIIFSKYLFPTWHKEAFDKILDAVGIGFILLGFLFRVSARGYKAKMSASGSCLITNGPYVLIRNPMYFGTFLIGLGINIVLFSWWVFLIFLAVFLLIYPPQICKEEENLLKRFGDEYKNYCRLTPRYFPNIFLFFTLDPREYLPFKWRWIKKELLSFIGVIGLVVGIEIWEEIRLFGWSEFKKKSLELVVIFIVFTLILISFYEKKDISRKS